MIDVLAGTFVAAAALLLVFSGVAKLRHPGTAATLVRRLLPRAASAPWRAVALVCAMGLGEIAVGLGVLASGARPVLALLVVAYVGFATVAVIVLRGGAPTSCGCFGRADNRLGPGHLVLNVVAVAAGVAALLRPPGPGVGLLDGGGLTATTSAAQASLLAALGYLAVTALPALLAARRALVPSTRRPQELR